MPQELSNMSVLHVNQIKNRLESEYLPFVDDLDLCKLQPEAKHVNKYQVDTRRIMQIHH